MMRDLLRHEWRLLRADRTAHGLFVVLVLTIGLAAYVGADWTRFQRANLALAERQEQERLARVETELQLLERGGQPESSFTDPRFASVLGGGRAAHTVKLPPGALSGLAVGQSDLLPYQFQVTTWTNERSFLANGELENPHNLLAGRFDLAFVIVYILPLLVIALTYNLLSAERENGTLALTLSQPVALPRIVLSKLWTRVLLLTCLTAVLAMGTAAAVGVDLVSLPSLGRLIIFGLISTLYLGFWFAAAIAINGLGRSSAFNATALACVWLGLVVVLPALVQFAASALHPVPSRMQMVGYAREMSAGATRERSRLLARYYEDHPEMLGGEAPDPNNFAALGYVTQEEVNRRLRTVMARYESSIAAQRRVVQRYRFLSPAILVQEALIELAGTSPERFALFQAQASAFAEEWKRFFVPRIMRADSMKSGITRMLPRFEYREEPLTRAAGRTAVPGLALLGFLFAATLWAVRSLRRFPLTV
jgi:ABC-2 type transport system permease protein